jgi:hypothetical protein
MYLLRPVLFAALLSVALCAKPEENREAPLVAARDAGAPSPAALPAADASAPDAAVSADAGATDAGAIDAGAFGGHDGGVPDGGAASNRPTQKRK